MVSQWNSSGIFPRIHLFAALPQSPRVHVKYEQQTTRIYRTDHLHVDGPVHEDQLQKYQERVQRLSQQNRVIKFCIDARFLTTVDVGQYFMTNDTEEFSNFSESVACREYTLPRDENHLTRKFGFEGIQKLGPC